MKHILLYKLSYFGIRGNFFSWLKSYSCSHTQVVKMNSYVSNVLLVSSGVLQGSHLLKSPLIYIIY